MKRFCSLVTVFLVSLFLLFIPAKISADIGWVIDTFDSDISVNKDGTVAIRETIAVNFNDLSKHGIFRDIPYVYQNEKGEKTYTEIIVSSVTRNQTSEPYSITTNEYNKRIKIGNPDKTISGKHVYTISYTAKGILRSFEQYDELYWNVTGNDWETAITQGTATVKLPQDKILQTVCFQGTLGSSDECEKQQENTTATFTTTRSLVPPEGFTIVVAYTKGMVPILTVAAPPSFIDQAMKPVAIATFLIPIVSTVLFFFLHWKKHGKDFWWPGRRLSNNAEREVVKPLGANHPVVVAFESPEQLRPAEVGVLMDERADTLDVTATIIDLAQRGYLSITEKEKSWMFGATDYILTQTEKPIEELLPYEKKLYHSLFTKREVTVSELKTTFYDDLAKVKTQLYKDMVDKKFFPTNPESVRTKYLLLSLAILGIGAFFLFIDFSFSSIADKTFGAGMVISGIIAMFFSRIMPRRSALGHDYYQKALGYRLFISGAEKYRQQFFEKKNMMNEILPYAIVFGLTGKFAKAMNDLGVQQQQPTWYHGTHPFHMASFTNDVNQFSKSLSSAIAATPSRSGSSGGGFSGGGFGGGGGGSW